MAVIGRRRRFPAAPSRGCGRNAARESRPAPRARAETTGRSANTWLRNDAGSRRGQKIVRGAIKNNPQVIVALILVLGELVRGPGASALTSAEAEDAVDEVEAGNNAAPLEHCRWVAD